MSDYTGATYEEKTFGTMSNPTELHQQTEISRDTYRPRNEKELMAQRTHYVYSARAEQLRINWLAITGGRDYVDARLSRFAGETKIAWEGGQRRDGYKVTGRKNQAHVVPYLGRMADKVNQFVFSKRPVRNGALDEHVTNVDNRNTHVNDFMARVNLILMSCGWAWIGVDQINSASTDGPISISDKSSLNIRPIWTLYNPSEVVDWCINPMSGLLDWVITEGMYYNASDPKQEATWSCVRKLWEPGQVTTYYLNAKKTDVEKIEGPQYYDYDKVPFLLCGKISDEAIPWDDLESIQRTILDLESCSRQNWFNTVFPQVVLPASLMRSSKADQLASSSDENVQRKVGFKYPILIDKDDPLPFYLTPNTTAYAQMRAEINELVNSLKDSFGFLIRKETAQAESAQSKAFDFVDVEQFLVSQSERLEKIETDLVAITNMWDPSFALYEPKYNKDFAVQDYQSMMATISQASQLPMPVELTRVWQRVCYDVLSKLGKGLITPEVEKQVLEAIENYEEEIEPEMENIFPVTPAGVENAEGNNALTQREKNEKDEAK